MKKLKFIMVFLFIIIIVCCKENPSRELTKEDFQIEYAGTKISLYEFFYDVTSKQYGGSDLSYKINRQKVSDRGTLFVLEELVCRGLKMIFSFNRIEKFEITDEQSKTFRNIKIGMTESDVTKAYGKAHSIVKADSGNKKIIYRMKGDKIFIYSYELIFDIVNKKINSIILQIDYDRKKILTMEDFSILSKTTNRSYHVLQNMEDIIKDFSEKPEINTSYTNKDTEYEVKAEDYQFRNAVFYTSDITHDYSETSDIYSGLYEIAVNGSGWATLRDIVVGDTKEKVLNVYGIYDEDTCSQEDSKEILHYVFMDYGLEEVYGRLKFPYINGLVLDFIIENDKVKEIRLSYYAMGD